ncbi:proteasome core particle subunit beta 3 [Metarhizium rileyi]|uniref:Proteasome core particle subunit beta 3 n=1 Tax=Metarhizium rileyi (strain RCEF 4871) TaxID=1649241 RepID=A0A5C6GLA4_METRR|nr:proteasome core particle subunit beta 3 [Metarhizium rileyi]
MLYRKALVSILGAAAAVHGLVARQTGGGQSYPDCGGLQRIESVPNHMNPNDKLYRSSAPYYDLEDSDQRITDETIRCLRQLGITHVISLNAEADNQGIRQALQDQGIAYTALATPDFHPPSVNQLQEGWDAFRGHRQSTLVWCGFGHGRTGTMITALQMYAQAERGETLRWTREQYQENFVERDSQRSSKRSLPGEEFRVFSRNAKGNLIERAWENGEWWPYWILRDGYIASEPAAMVINDQALRVYARSGTNELVEGAFNDGKWQSWNSLGGEIASAPTAIWLGDSLGVRVYARNKANRLMEITYSGGRWSSWQNLGGDIVGDPSAIWMGDDVGIRVYARNRAGKLMEKSYQSGGWHEWKNLGGSISSSPAAIALAPGDVRIYASNDKYELVEQGTGGGDWQSAWSSLGGKFTGSPGAIWLGDSGIRVYAQNAREPPVEGLAPSEFRLITSSASERLLGPQSLVTMSSPFSINGGACVAMVGKDCVAIACDLRLGLQALTVSNNFPKIFQYGDVFLGLTGLATDVGTVSDLFRYKVNMYRLREERDIAPRTFANLVSSSLYERRFGPYFVSPVVAGLDPKTGKPFICGFDSIGCIDFAKDFIVSGTASEQLFGMCEGLWEADMGPDALFETISQALLNAVDRDALSGWGAHVYIIEKDKVTKRLLKGRQD